MRHCDWGQKYYLSHFPFLIEQGMTRHLTGINVLLVTVPLPGISLEVYSKREVNVYAWKHFTGTIVHIFSHTYEKMYLSESEYNNMRIRRKELNI